MTIWLMPGSERVKMVLLAASVGSAKIARPMRGSCFASMSIWSRTWPTADPTVSFRQACKK